MTWRRHQYERSLNNDGPGGAPLCRVPACGRPFSADVHRPEPFTPAPAAGTGNEREGLREALARWLFDWDDGDCYAAAELLLAGPLADLLAAQEAVRELAVPGSIPDGGPYMDGWNAAMHEIRRALDGEP